MRLRGKVQDFPYIESESLAEYADIDLGSFADKRCLQACGAIAETIHRCFPARMEFTRTMLECKRFGVAGTLGWRIRLHRRICLSVLNMHPFPLRRPIRTPQVSADPRTSSRLGSAIQKSRSTMQDSTGSRELRSLCCIRRASSRNPAIFFCTWPNPAAMRRKNHKLQRLAHIFYLNIRISELAR